MKRVTWFVGGVATGVAGASYARRKVKAKAAELAPVQIARQAGERVRDVGRSIADAVRDGRAAMRAKEAELRARLDGRAGTLADELGEGDVVHVDGRPVEAGQVIVLRQVAPGQMPRRHAAR